MQQNTFDFSLSGQVGTGRVSETPGRAEMLAGGMGYIGRRGVPANVVKALSTIGGVEKLAQFQPLELMILCADLVPEVSQAVWNILLLGCGPGAVKLRAVSITADGNSEDAPEGTALIKTMFENQPQEAGDFDSQLAQNVLMTLFSGMAATEAVPGPEMTGVANTWPIDTLTLEFRRAPDQSLVVDQHQVGPVSPQSLPFGTGAGTNLVPMPMQRFFWDSMHRFPGDPYGRAPFAAALQPILDYLGFIRDLTVAFHRVGMPRYDIEFDFKAALEFATRVKNLVNTEDIARDVKRQFTEFKTNFNTLRIDDAFIHPVGTKVNVTGSGADMPDVPGIFDVYRYRVVLALKQNPVLMSFVEGSTETWSDIQWEVFTIGLTAVVTTGASPLKDAAQLHLRLLGKPWKVEVITANVRSISRLTDAQAEELEIDNEARKRDEGWQTQDSASQKITGSKAVSQTSLRTQIAVTQAEKAPPAAPAPAKPPSGSSRQPAPQHVPNPSSPAKPDKPAKR